MKRVDTTYRWKNPTIVDRTPDFLAYLATKPRHQEALAYRRLELKRRGWEVDVKKLDIPPREEVDLFDLKPSLRLL